MRNSAGEAGFTLLELIVVLFIIGLLVNLASLSINKATNTQRLEHSALQLTLAVDLIAQSAVLSSRPTGMSLRENGFSLTEFERGWRAFETAARFSGSEFEPGIIVKSLLEEADINDESPAIVFLPDGESYLPPLEIHDLNSGYFVTLEPVNGRYELGAPQL